MHRFALAAVIIATFMIGFDTTGLGIIIPGISNALGVSLQSGAWLSIAYTVGFAVFLLPGGVMVDRLGVVASFILALVAFCFISICITMASSLSVLVFLRFVQGVAAAIISTSSMAFMNSVFPTSEPGRRTKAFSAWSMTLGVSFALGPILGTLLSTFFGWRFIFLVNIAFVVCIAILLHAFFKRSDFENTVRSSKVSMKSVLPTSAFLTLLLLSPVMDVFLPFNREFVVLSGGALCLIFAFYIHRKDSDSYTRIPELKDTRFIVSLLLPVIFSISYWSLFVSLPQYLYGESNLNSSEVSSLMFLLALPLIVYPLVIKKVPLNLRPSLSFVFICSGLIAIYAYAAIRQEKILLYLGVLILGVGAASLNPQMARIVLDRVSMQNSGIAAAITGTLRQVGFALGVMIYTQLFSLLHLEESFFSTSSGFLLCAALSMCAVIIVTRLDKRS